jgi:hypothetical protein
MKAKKVVSNPSKTIDVDYLSEQKLNGYFLFYRSPVKKTDIDVVPSREFYSVFFLLNKSLAIIKFSTFKDTFLIDPKNFKGVSPVYSNSNWASLKLEKDSVLNLLKKKYSFLVLQEYNFYPLITNSIPIELIKSNKAFISIFEGDLIVTEKLFNAEYGFSNMNAENFGTCSTYLLLPNSENKLQYRFSISF